MSITNLLQDAVTVIILQHCLFFAFYSWHLFPGKPPEMKVKLK